jgi:hypothetical protein
MEMLNKEKIVDDILVIAYTHPTDTILVKLYYRNGGVDVYASDYFITKSDEVMPDAAIWKVKIEIVSGVIEGQWRVTGSQTYEDNRIVSE